MSNKMIYIVQQLQLFIHLMLIQYTQSAFGQSYNGSLYI